MARQFSAEFLGRRETVDGDAWVANRRAETGYAVRKPAWAIFALHKETGTIHQHGESCVRFVGWANSLKDARRTASWSYPAPRRYYTVAYVPSTEVQP